MKQHAHIINPDEEHSLLMGNYQLPLASSASVVHGTKRLYVSVDLFHKKMYYVTERAGITSAINIDLASAVKDYNSL